LALNENHFDMWVRQAEGEPDRFDLKFDVHTGKGFLRTPHVGGTSSTPASSHDTIPALSAADLSNSKFSWFDDSSNRDRTEFGFAAETIDDIKAIKPGNWTRVSQLDDTQLKIQQSVPPVSQQKQAAVKAKMMPDDRSSHPERKSAAVYICELESDLERTRRHVDQLKKRIADLEAEVEGLGGKTRPLILE